MNWTAHFPVWREILLTLILIIVFYMVWLIWKMRRLGQSKPPSRTAGAARDEPTLAAAPTSASSRNAQATPEENDELPLTYTKPSALRPRHAGHPSSPSRAADGMSGTGLNTGSIAQKAILDGVTRELKETREELDTLRDAFAQLRDEMDTLRSNQKLTQAQNASPLYNEAMQMAILGHDALTISERCGISRAEADLVVSLMKNKDGKTP